MIDPMQVLRGKDEAVARFKNRGQEAEDPALTQRVQEILKRVRREGDAALRALSEEIEGVGLEHVEVPSSAFDKAEEKVPQDLKNAISLAAARIRAYYGHQPKEGFLHQDEGGLLGQIVRPLERVGCYVPGGQAPLFSTLLMTAVPAQVAGVPEIVVATPPSKNGELAPEILVTARLLGIDTVYRLGGALAVAALAYGTESVARVDKIVGPGNRYTVAAKKLVYGEVGIEALPGPTETLVLADEHADVRHVIADLLAQAEHDGAQPVLVTTSNALVDAVRAGLGTALENLSTAETARASLDTRGFIVLVSTLEEAIEVANAYAPEHLCLLVQDPWALVPQVKHAGGLFIGEHSLEALGDYIAGPSHVMPTGGTARFSSFVNVRDFQKVMPVLSLSEALLSVIGPKAATMARAEGLEAHARAVESRLPENETG